MPVRSTVLLLTAVCAVLRAQSPTVALPAAPTRDDSIYALRIDPADYRGHDEVLLFDEGVVRVEADGRSSYTLRQVVQLLTPDGVEGEVPVPAIGTAPPQTNGAACEVPLARLNAALPVSLGK